MPNINLAILNQKATPAFFADTLANRPAPSFVGRIFISTDTLDLYRDTGTAWLLLSPSSTGTITGSGAAGQVTYFSGASSITGSNDLFWDSVNGHLGIGTNVPGTALNIFHDQNQIIQLNQTTATNDTKIAFQNNGVGLWRIGNSYNAGANDFGIYDNIGAIQQFTIKKTTGQTFVGAQTTSSGRLVVNDTTGDNHIVVIGATAPSLRINNSGSGATKQIGIGLATATNNFIQGAVDRDMTIFNGSTTPSPILFGIYGTTNIQEAARISASRNFLIGTTTDSGYKLNVNGTGYINDRLVIDGNNTGQYIQFFNNGVDRAHIYWQEGLNNLSIGTYVAGGSIQFEVGNNVDAMFLYSSGNLGINTTSDLGYKLNVNGTGYFNGSLSSAGLIRLESSASGSIVVGSRSAQTDFQLYNTGNVFRIYDGSRDAFTIGTSGNIGVNTTNAVAGLQVEKYGSKFDNDVQYNQPSGNVFSSFTGVVPDQENWFGMRGSYNSATGSSNLLLQANYRDVGSQAGHYVASTGVVLGVSNFSIGILTTSTSTSTPATKVEQLRLVGSTGNLLIGTTTDAGYKLSVNGNSLISGTLNVTGSSFGNSITVSQGISIGDGYGLNAGGFQVGGITGNRFYIYNNGLAIDNILIDASSGVTRFNRRINLQALPTSSAGLSAGDVWNNSGVLNIV